MRTFFTFGTESPYARRYVEVIHEKTEDARTVMLMAHGPKWAFEYNEVEFMPQITRFKYRILAVIMKNQFGHWEAA